MENRKRALGGGRKLKPSNPSNASEIISIRVTPERKAKFISLGGATWIALAIDKAFEAKEKEGV